MSLQTSLQLGNYPVSSLSVRLHHIAIDLRKRPVGRRPVPSFPAPRAIPKPLHSRSHVPIRTGRADDPVTWPAIQIAGSACAGSRKDGRVERHYAWLLAGRRASDFCARSVRPGRSDLRTRDHAELLGTVDLAHSGTDFELRPHGSDGAIWTACWSWQAVQHRARYRSPSRCSGAPFACGG